MDDFGFHDGNIHSILESRYLDSRHGISHSLQMHSSLIRRFALERELEGHQGCVNAIAWNTSGSLLISGSDDTRMRTKTLACGNNNLFAAGLTKTVAAVGYDHFGALGDKMNIWGYNGRKLLHSIDTGHTANIFCTKFIPETSDELVVSGAGDAEVRVFNLSRLSGRGAGENVIAPTALYQCHTKRVKKLAVEVGNPNLVWSASEDGTLRQHDFREGVSCPPVGSSPQECRNILLDLRCGAKNSLADPPKQTLALKSCDISASRPHLLIVGGSDAFARLYDRRMLPPLTSCRKRMSPPYCVNYYCPMHLSERGRSGLHLTHVAFSPSGDEVLLSYSGEHVYLMNVCHAEGSATEYSSADVSKLVTFTPTLNGLVLDSPKYHKPTCGLKNKSASVLEKCRKLVQVAEKYLEDGANYFDGIEACSEVLNGHGRDISPATRHDCLCIRAALLLKRKWKNDVHMAIRDCYKARKIDNTSFRALYYMSNALSQLGKHKDALEFALAAQRVAPANNEIRQWVESIKKNIAAAEAEKNVKPNDGLPRSESRSGRALSLSDILYRSETNSDASQDGPRSEREDSDYDEELELDFETSMSGDEGHDLEPNTLHGSLNLRIHRRGDSSRDTSHTNGSCGSPSSSLNDRTLYQSDTAVDMKQRYVGHCNVGTDIKQASFLGQKGEFVASGSDDGRWFIWEKSTGRLIKMLLGDEAVVNCVQCHPFDSVIATSGIDNTIKIWSPTASVPSIVAGGAAGPDTPNVLEVMESNERRLNHNREVILPFELLERFRMHEVAEGHLHPLECTQT